MPRLNSLASIGLTSARLSFGLFATVPSSITLAVGSTNPVGGVTNVSIPSPGGTDATGAATGWVTSTASNIKFTVVNGGSATSTITINGSAYTSGNDYTIGAIGTLTIVVTTSETGKSDAIRTFTIPVTAPGRSTVPSSITLAVGSTNPVGGVTNVAIPTGGIGMPADQTGAVTGWVTSTASNIKFTVVNGGSAISTITINGSAYTSGNDYTIGVLGYLYIAVTTSETGRITITRTFTIPVSSASSITFKSYYGASGLFNSLTTNSTAVSGSISKFGTKSLTVLYGGPGTFDNPSALIFPLSSSLSPPWTIECWLYPTSVYANGDSGPISLYLQNTNTWSISPPYNTVKDTTYVYLLNNGTGGLAAAGFVQPGLQQTFQGLPTMNTNAWNHVAITCSNTTTFGCWINGASLNSPAGAFTMTAFTPTLNYLILNANLIQKTWYIDEVRVSNIARYAASSTSITPPTTTFTSDANTVALINFE